MVMIVKCEIYYSLRKHIAWFSYSWGIFGQIEILLLVTPLRHFCLIEAFDLQLFQLFNIQCFSFLIPLLLSLLSDEPYGDTAL